MIWEQRAMGTPLVSHALGIGCGCTMPDKEEMSLEEERLYETLFRRRATRLYGELADLR